MNFALIPKTQFPFHSFPNSHQPNRKSKLENPTHHQFCSVSSSSYRNRVKAAINNQYTITQSSNSLYELLGVEKNGNTSEIKRAYKQLARKYHPDVSPPGRTEEYTRKFIRVQEAYETLSDPQSRAMYDRDMSPPLQFDKRWVDWMWQLKELERRSMNKKNSRGKNVRWRAQNFNGGSRI